MLPNQIPAASPEVVALTSAIVDVLTAIKAGQGGLAAAEAALPDLLAAAQTVSSIGVDIKLPQNQAFIAYGIAQVYEPAVVAPAT